MARSWPEDFKGSYRRIVSGGHGGIGRHAGFRFRCASVQVQILLPAPNWCEIKIRFTSLHDPCFSGVVEFFYPSGDVRRPKSCPATRSKARQSSRHLHPLARVTTPHRQDACFLFVRCCQIPPYGRKIKTGRPARRRGRGRHPERGYPSGGHPVPNSRRHNPPGRSP